MFALCRLLDDFRDFCLCLQLRFVKNMHVVIGLHCTWVSNWVSSVFKLRQVWSRVDCIARNTVLVLIIVRDRVDRLSRLLAILHELAAVDLRVHHLGVVVRLHKVWYAPSSSRVEHLLASLAVLGHHLVVVMLLLLFEFVVECMELCTLSSVRRGEDCIDVLSQRDLWAESIYLVVVAATRHSNIRYRSTFLLFATSREFIEVRCLLNHARLGDGLRVILAYRISLKLVNASRDRLNLDWQFECLVSSHFVPVALWSRGIWVSVHADKLFISLTSPLSRWALFCQSLVASSKRRWSSIVTAHHLEIDLGITAELRAP